MINFSQAIKSKSDQLNSADLIKPRIIKITAIVDKQAQDAKQPMWIYYEGDCGAPWKPSLGMRKIIISMWGDDNNNLDVDACIGRLIEIYNEPTVVYAGKQSGGIRICGMSHIQGNFTTRIKVNRSKTDEIKVRKLEEEQKPPYPAEKFEAAFATMCEYMQSGSMTFQGVVARLQETGTLSDDQLRRLKDHDPLDEEE